MTITDTTGEEILQLDIVENTLQINVLDAIYECSERSISLTEMIKLRDYLNQNIKLNLLK